MSSNSQLLTLLAGIDVPGTTLTAADIADIHSEQHATLHVGYPIAQVKAAIAAHIEANLAEAGVVAKIDVVQDIPAVQPANAPSRIDGVKNIIAVASGKGGVGKSTSSVNLALALAYEGARVGILDADIYGPSLPQMMGLGAQRPEVIDNSAIKPLIAYGVQVVSMGSLVTENTPMIWRGPMVSGALKQLLNQTQWDNLDYLIIDMPPGTGDIQLTLSQSVPVSTSVIVTTPQDIALLDAKKGIEMFRKVNIPVVGVIENMSVHICSACGHKEAIFGEEGGDILAREFDTQVLGRIPLQKAIREQVDAGKPPVAFDPCSAVSEEYRAIAAKVAGDIWTRSQSGSGGPQISIADD